MSEPASSRDKILDVAEALFAQRGHAGVGLREVAESSGLSKSALFHHFRSKDQLYFEVHLRVLRQIRERFDAVAARSSSAREQLEAWLTSLIDQLAEHPPVSRLLLRSLFEKEDAQIPEAEAAEAMLASILADAHHLLHRGVDEGWLRPLSVPHTVQTLIGATIYHFASGEVGEAVLGRSPFSAEEVSRRKRELIALLRHGIFRGPEGSDGNETGGPAWTS